MPEETKTKSAKLTVDQKLKEIDKKLEAKKAELKKKLDDEKAKYADQLKRLAQRKRAVEFSTKKKERKLDTRRKIITGAIALNYLQNKITIPFSDYLIAEIKKNPNKEMFQAFIKNLEAMKEKKAG